MAVIIAGREIISAINYHVFIYLLYETMDTLVNSTQYRTNLSFNHACILRHNSFSICSPEIEYFPEIKSMDPNDEQTIVELIRFLENRIQIRDLLREDLLQKRIFKDIFSQIVILSITFLIKSIQNNLSRE